MKAYLFILLCLFVSIYSQNCTEVPDQDVTDVNSCFFKEVTNETYTCCYVEIGTIKTCVEAEFENFENDTTKEEAIKQAIDNKGGYDSSNFKNYDCDSNHRDPNVVINQKNYLYVGLLTLLSLFF